MTENQQPAEITIVQKGRTALAWMLLVVALAIGYVGAQLTTLNATLHETDPYYVKTRVCEASDGEISTNTQGNLVCDVPPYAATTENKFQFDNGDFIIL